MALNFFSRSAASASGLRAHPPASASNAKRIARIRAFFTSWLLSRGIGVIESRRSVGSQRLPAGRRDFFGQNDRLRQFAHGPPHAAALVAKTQIGAFFAEAIADLQDAFGALHALAGFQLLAGFEC